MFAFQLSCLPASLFSVDFRLFAMVCSCCNLTGIGHLTYWRHFMPAQYTPTNLTRNCCFPISSCGRSELSLHVPGSKLPLFHKIGEKLINQGFIYPLLPIIRIPYISSYGCLAKEKKSKKISKEKSSPAEALEILAAFLQTFGQPLDIQKGSDLAIYNDNPV